MKFKILPRRTWDNNPEPYTVYLEIDHWNDFSFVTQFNMCYLDDSGTRISIGVLKIGFKGQTEEMSTHSTFSEALRQFQSATQQHLALSTYTSCRARR